MTKTIKTAKTSRKSVNKEQFNMQLAHETEIDLTADDAVLASMLADIEEAAPTVVDVADDHAIEAAVAEIEKAEAIEQIYAEQESAPEADIATVEPKAKKAKKAKAPKEPKAPAAPVVRYNGHRTNASDVLKAKLGEKFGDMLVLEVDDASLDAGALAEKQDSLLKLLNARPGTGEASSQQKVAEKVVMLFNWLAKGGKLNEVMERTFKVLVRDGEITTGNGNLHAELLAKPYSVGTARAQAGQMYSMLPMLKIATLAEKGKLVANPNSMILMAVKAQLGL